MASEQGDDSGRVDDEHDYRPNVPAITVFLITRSRIIRARLKAA
jgi:hypothetical protein